MPARGWTVLLAMLLALAAWATAPCAPVAATVHAPIEPGECEEVVRIRIQGIRASTGEPWIDPEIRGLANQLAFTPYDVFRVLQSETFELADEQRWRVRFGLRTLRVQLLDHDGSYARVRLKLYGDDGTKQLDTTVRVRRNRTFLVAGPKVGADVVILPVTVSW